MPLPPILILILPSRPLITVSILDCWIHQKSMSRSQMRRLRATEWEGASFNTALYCQLWRLFKPLKRKWEFWFWPRWSKPQTACLLPTTTKTSGQKAKSKFLRTLESYVKMVGCGGSGHMRKGFPIFFPSFLCLALSVSSHSRAVWWCRS